jgi:hypothetical protein
LKNESPIERRILDYLKAHPGAQDTMRGIVEWWLPKQRIAETMSEVETALSKLVATGQLVAHRGPDGQVFYHLGSNAADKDRKPE